MIDKCTCAPLEKQKQNKKKQQRLMPLHCVRGACTLIVLRCVKFVSRLKSSRNEKTLSESFDPQLEYNSHSVLVFIFRLHNKWTLWYRAFCAGSIITHERVLTSAHCLVTNKKRRRYNFDHIRVVAGILHVQAQQPIFDDVQQWRMIAHLYSQRLFRFPAYDLAIIQVEKPWIFNKFVNKIPYAKLDQDFDGVCVGTAVKTTKSWSRDRYLYAANFHLTSRQNCERQLLRSCLLYYCTDYDVSMSSSTEIEGGGLICHGTGDPAEDENLGLLVGVLSLINIGLPSLHNRVGPFHAWITDHCNEANINLYLLFACITLIMMTYLKSI